MAYCTITDVQALNSNRGAYSTTTTPTATEVNGFITQIGNEIDSLLLARGLVTPITTPAEFVSTLLLGNSQGAAALAEMAMFPEAGAMGGSPHGKELWAQYEKFKKWLQEGKLPGSLSGSNPEPRSFHEQNQAAETEPTEAYDWQKPKIRKNMEF